MRRVRWLVLLLCGAWVSAGAHVGSTDVFETVQAGPYKLYVTLRPPVVVPGAVGVEVRVSAGDVAGVDATSLPLVGVPAKLPPVAEPMVRDGVDGEFYTGSVWLMAAGSWQVRLVVHGAQGDAVASVPVPSAPLYVQTMGRGLGWVLALLAVVLAVGLVAMVYGAVCEASLAVGERASEKRQMRARVAAGATLVLVVALLAAGDRWWDVEAAGSARDLYHPLRLLPVLRGDTLELTLAAGALDPMHRPMAQHDLLMDHGHLMHLYAIRWPEMNAAFHLHPALKSGWTLSEELPAMPAGTYRLFADVVHANGFPETLTATLDVPAGLKAVPLSSEDAEALPTAIDAGLLGDAYRLPDGYTMRWERPVRLRVGEPTVFRFVLLDAAGKPALDVHPYLGMAGHAAFVKVDGSVFVHTHPEGTVAMPAMMLAEEGLGAMPMSAAEDAVIPAVVEFPFGMPSAGRYRIFVQMKHGETVETGVFDVVV